MGGRGTSSWICYNNVSRPSWTPTCGRTPSRLKRAGFDVTATAPRRWSEGSGECRPVRCARPERRGSGMGRIDGAVRHGFFRRRCCLVNAFTHVLANEREAWMRWRKMYSLLQGGLLLMTDRLAFWIRVSAANLRTSSTGRLSSRRTDLRRRAAIRIPTRTGRSSFDVLPHGNHLHILA